MFSSFSDPRKGIQDSLGFGIPPSKFRIPGTGFRSLSMELGFGIPWTVFWIPNPGFQIPQANFPRFWIPQAKTSWIPESGFPRRRHFLYKSDWTVRVPQWVEFPGIFCTGINSKKELYGYKKSLIRLCLEMHASLPGLLSWNNVMA